jgi:hypothetical protein
LQVYAEYRTMPNARAFYMNECLSRLRRMETSSPCGSA